MGRDGDGWGGVPREGDRVGYGGTLPGAIFWSSQDYIGVVRLG